MACNVYRDPDGKFTAIVCGPKRFAKPCSSCGRPHTKLCDFPLTGIKKGKTCDRRLCNHCAVPDPNDKDRDYCPIHAKMIAEGLKL